MKSYNVNITLLTYDGRKEKVTLISESNDNITAMNSALNRLSKDDKKRVTVVELELIK